MVKIKIICHGGAWSIPDEAKEKSLEGIRRAAEAGIEVLKSGKSEDAVVAAVSGIFGNSLDSDWGKNINFTK